MKRMFICMDCGQDTGDMYEYYYVKPEIWFSIHNSEKGMLCIGCLEKRLGRLLNKDDFTNCTLNNPKFSRMSIRLLDRIRRTA